MEQIIKTNKTIKRDIILIGALLFVAIALLIIINVLVKKDGTYVIVKVDGEIVYELPIDEDTTITINGVNNGVNTLVIDDKNVYVTDSDCPDKVCEKTGKISKSGETIVCLPHRVVIEIKGDTRTIDGVVS